MNDLKEKEFIVNNVPYKILGEDVYRLPFNKDKKNFNLKKLIPNYKLKYKLNGKFYSMEEIINNFL